MNFPQTLTVTVHDAETGQPVSKVAVVLVLKAQQKNDYLVGPVVTDANGKLFISNADCQNAIRRAQEMFVMDYSGDLSTCGSAAELKLHPPEHLQRMIAQFQASPEFWGKAFDQPEQLMTSLEDVGNANYEPFSVLLVEDEICRNPKVDVQIVKSQSIVEVRRF